MKNQWKAIKFGVLLFTLPLVATAAASAHQWMVESNPISIKIPTVAVANSAIGVERVHTVALNGNGSIEGRIASIAVESKNTKGLGKLKVYFVQDGEVVKESFTQADGTFVVQGVPEGAYSFVATGQNGFAAYGVRVVSDSTGKYDNVMETAAVSPRFAAVKKILNDKLPKEVAQQIIQDGEIPSATQVVGANRVGLNNGQLTGHVVSLLGDVESVVGTFVHILQNDEQLAEVQTDESGSFMVSDLAPGIYDFVAAGPNGFAAVSFEAVEETEAGLVSELIDTNTIPVSVVVQDETAPIEPIEVGYAKSFDVCLTSSQDAAFVGEQVDSAGGEIVYDQGVPIEYASESIGCGCAAGGSCGEAGNFSNFSSCNACGGAGGGGGGGGGFAGGGRLLRLGLIGGIIALAVTSGDPDDGSPNTPN